MVDCVVVFPAELQRIFLRDREHLAQRQVGQELTGAEERIPANIAIAIGALGLNVCRRVEPFSAVGVRDVRAANLVGPHGVEVRVQQRSVGDVDREGWIAIARRGQSSLSDQSGIEVTAG
jgi:hypothetical protein